MKLLLILLLHPSAIVENRARFSLFILNGCVAGYAAMCGLAFQHLYPRVLNNVPWLGFLRRLSPMNWNPGFQDELFFRGAGMSLLLLLSSSLAYFVFGLATGHRKPDISSAYLGGLATCLPFLLCCAGGFFFYYLDPALGLLPGYGIIATVCMQVILMRDMIKVPRSLVVYLAPLLVSAQIYGCYLLLP